MGQAGLQSGAGSVPDPSHPLAVPTPGPSSGQGPRGFGSVPLQAQLSPQGLVGTPMPPTHGDPAVPKATGHCLGCWAGTGLGLPVKNSCATSACQGDTDRPRGWRGHHHFLAQVLVPQTHRAMGWEKAAIPGDFYSLQEFIQLVSDFSSTEGVLNSYKLLRVNYSQSNKQTNKQKGEKKGKKRNNLEKQ